jgi:glycosyltransferase involved in cell wall biosynthesis
MKKSALKFSIVIPTYKRAALLKTTLTSLMNISYDVGSYEIIVVDNDQSDITEPIVRKYIQDNPKKNIHLITTHEQGPSHARNRGVEHSQFDHIIFIDDDIIVPRNILTLFSTTIKAHPDAIIIGTKIRLIHAIPKTISPLCKAAPWVLAKTMFTTKNPRYLTYPQMLGSASMYVNKTYFKRSRIFNEILGKKYRNIFIGGEDTELCFRLIFAHKKILYTPHISVVHNFDQNRLSVKYFLLRFIESGITNRIIDEQLQKQFKRYVIYSIPYKDFFYYLADILRKKEKSFYASLFIQELLFIYGYFFYQLRE